MTTVESEHPEQQAFWMKNTYIPLSIAFIDTDGRILNIDDMAPQTEETHLSKGPAQYALEMRKGWFKERGIGTGAVLDGTVDAYVHAGGQYEWDSAAPVAVARSAGLHASRIDGSPLRYNQPDPLLPDLLICRPEHAELLLAAISALREDVST